MTRNSQLPFFVDNLTPSVAECIVTTGSRGFAQLPVPDSSPAHDQLGAIQQWKKACVLEESGIDKLRSAVHGPSMSWFDNVHCLRLDQRKVDQNVD